MVKSEEQTLAKDHPDRLASQHELASAYQAGLGQLESVDQPFLVPARDFHLISLQAKIVRHLLIGALVQPADACRCLASGVCWLCRVLVGI